ncbi:MAG: type III pantothenate kinase [Planctomycetes bacterium]|nr:type III pantothenate kinase [Planctomycetota bacterium]
MGGTRELITIDVGNSACKARRWRLDSVATSAVALGSEPLRPVPAPPGPLRSGPSRPRPLRLDAWEHPTRAGLGAELAGWLARTPVDVRAGLSSVAATEVGLELERVLGARLVTPLDAGLASEYRTPETLGADRLFAARAAAELVGRSCLVVDVGTAVTVDALRVAPDGTRTFLGGAIAPGPTLLAEALHSGTARLPRIEPRADAPALGRDTREALGAGVVHGLRGLVRGLVDAVGRDAGLDGAPVVLGGGALALLGAEPFPGRTVELCDDLVHLGLLAALCDALDGAR